MLGTTLCRFVIVADERQSRWPEDPYALRVSTSWGQLRRNVRWKSGFVSPSSSPHDARNATLQTSATGH
jgi:hypothetical protein